MRFAILLCIPIVAVCVAGAISVYDGFEGDSLSAENWETSRFAAGAVTMQSQVVRAGHGAVKITVRPRDEFEAGINGNADSERAELLEARKLTAKEDMGYEQCFSIFFPSDFPIVPTRLVIAQWKQFAAKTARAQMTARCLRSAT